MFFLLCSDEVNELFADTVSSEELATCPIVIFFNKTDITPPETLKTVKRQVLKHAEPFLRDRVYFVQECCALNGVGLYEGLDWAVTTLKHMPAATAAAVARKTAEPTEKDRCATVASHAHIPSSLSASYPCTLYCAEWRRSWRNG